jgi:hypothetical protein
MKRTVSVMRECEEKENLTYSLAEAGRDYNMFEISEL